MTIYDLQEITDATSIDADVIVPAMYAAVQPSVNLVLNKWGILGLLWCMGMMKAITHLS